MTSERQKLERKLSNLMLSRDRSFRGILDDIMRECIILHQHRLFMYKFSTALLERDYKTVRSMKKDSVYIDMLEHMIDRITSCSFTLTSHFINEDWES